MYESFSMTTLHYYCLSNEVFSHLQRSVFRSELLLCVGLKGSLTEQPRRSSIVVLSRRQNIERDCRFKISATPFVLMLKWDREPWVIFTLLRGKNECKKKNREKLLAKWDVEKTTHVPTADFFCFIKGEVKLKFLPAWVLFYIPFNFKSKKMLLTPITTRVAFSRLLSELAGF